MRDSGSLCESHYIQERGTGQIVRLAYWEYEGEDMGGKDSQRFLERSSQESNDWRRHAINKIYCSGGGFIPVFGRHGGCLKKG